MATNCLSSVVKMDGKIFLFLLLIWPLVQSRTVAKNSEIDDEQLRTLIERLAKSVESLARVVSQEKEHLVFDEPPSSSTFSPNVIPKSTPAPPISLPLLPPSNTTTTTSTTGDGLPGLLRNFLTLLHSLSGRIGGDEMIQLINELTEVLQTTLRIATGPPHSLNYLDVNTVQDDSTDWNSITEIIRQVLERHRINAIITHRNKQYNTTNDAAHQANITCTCVRNNNNKSPPAGQAYYPLYDDPVNVTNVAPQEVPANTTWLSSLRNLTVPPIVDPMQAALTGFREYIKSVEGANKRVNNVTSIMSQMLNSVARIATGQLRHNDSSWAYGQPIVRGVQSYVEVLRNFESHLKSLNDHFTKLRENLVPFVQGNRGYKENAPNYSDSIEGPVPNLIDEKYMTSFSDQIKALLEVTSSILTRIQQLMIYQSVSQQGTDKTNQKLGPLTRLGGEESGGDRRRQVSVTSAPEIAKVQPPQVTTPYPHLVSTINPARQFGEFVTEIIAVNGKLVKPLGQLSGLTRSKTAEKKTSTTTTTTETPEVEEAEDPIEEGVRGSEEEEDEEEKPLGSVSEQIKPPVDPEQVTPEQPTGQITPEQVGEVSGSAKNATSSSAFRRPEQLEVAIRQLQSGINRLLMAIKGMTGPSSV